MIISLLQILNPLGTHITGNERLLSAQRPLYSLEEGRVTEKLTCGWGLKSGEFGISCICTFTEQLYKICYFVPGTEFGVDIMMLKGRYDQIWEDGVGVLFFILPTMDNNNPWALYVKQT